MNNKEITLVISQTGDVPNAVQSQSGLSTTTDMPQEASSIFGKLPIKQIVGGLAIKKVATDLLQRKEMYTGNKVQQNNIDSMIKTGGKLVMLGGVAYVNPVVAGGMLLGEVYQTAVANMDITFNVEKKNMSANEERLLYNTNLNNNRYSGGSR